jgi:hypothetical protein
MHRFTKRTLAVTFTIGLAILSDRVSSAQSGNDIGKRLTFLATFDDSFDADFANGSSKMMTASNVGRSKLSPEMGVPGVTRDQNGKYGKALSFTKKTKAVYCFAAENNFAYSENSFDATISFWMKADLKSLPPGFIDPLQITDKKWNDAAIFVDFSDKSPRDFRMGVFSNLKFWNPNNKNYDKMPASERPLIDAGNVKFSPDRWTHIALVFKAVNSSDKQSRCQFFIDGKKIGQLDRSQKLTWNVKKAVIMLGIYFVGEMDDFAIFDSALTESQIMTVFKSPTSLKHLINQ